MTNPRRIRRDPALVAAALETWLPAHCDDPRARVLRIERPSGAGLSNETFLVDITSELGQESLVLQVGPAGNGLFKEYDLVTMARVQQQLAAVSDVPVAPVRWVEIGSQLLGSPFYLMSRVPGRVPSDNPAYHAAGWFAEISPATQRSVWLDGIAALVRLHALEPLSSGFAFLVDAPWGMRPGAHAALERLAQWRALLAWGAHQRVDCIEAALDQLAGTAPPPTGLAVCWGDAKISNCVIDDANLRALLDWELCGLSDPHEDLAHWLLIDWSHWRTQGFERLPALPSPRTTVEHYATLAKRDMPYVVWWFKLAFVRLAVIYHRFLERRIDTGRLEPQADLRALNPMCALLDEVLAMEQLP